MISVNRSAPTGYVLTMSALWLYEFRLSGRARLSLPLLVAVGVGGFVVWTDAGVASRFLVNCAIPLVAGLVAASVVAEERMIEVHVTVPVSYPRTVARRLCWVLLTSLAAGLLLALCLAATNSAVSPAEVLGRIVGFVLAILGVAACGAAASGSAAGASAMVLAVWMFKVIFMDQLLRNSAAHAVTMLVIAVLAAVLTTRLLHDVERRLREGTR